MIKAIVFDWGGVIEIKDRDSFVEIAGYLNVNIEDWRRVYYSYNYLANTGKKSMDDVLALTAKDFNASDEQIDYINSLRMEINKTKKINLELVEIIKKLKKVNYKIGLLSNTSSDLNRKLEEHNMLNLFDEIIISCEVGYQKPQPEIFQIIVNKMEVGINELLFIDDTERSLEGAESIGYVPILYKSNEQLKESLYKILGVIPR